MALPGGGGCNGNMKTLFSQAAGMRAPITQ